MNEEFITLIIEAIGINNMPVKSAGYSLFENDRVQSNTNTVPFPIEGVLQTTVLPGTYFLQVISEGYDLFESEIQVDAPSGENISQVIRIRLKPTNLKKVRFGNQEISFLHYPEKIVIIPASRNLSEIENLVSSLKKLLNLSPGSDKRNIGLAGDLDLFTKTPHSIILKMPIEQKGKRSTTKIESEIGKTIGKIRAHAGVKLAGSIFGMEGNNIAIFTSMATVTFRYDVLFDTIAGILAEAGAINFEVIPGTGYSYTVQFSKEIGIEIIDVLNQLYYKEEVTAVEPVIASRAEPEAIVPDDFLWPASWSRNRLANTGQAWEELQNSIPPKDPYGNSNVIIGVIDSGVKSALGVPENPDFQGTVTINAATTLTSAVVAPTQILTVASTVGIVVGMKVQIGRGEEKNKKVHAVDAGLNQITIDPLFFDHPTGAVVLTIAGAVVLTTLTAQVAFTKVTLNVVSGAGFSAGQSVSIGMEGNATTEQAVIIQVVGNVLTVSGLFGAHPVGSQVQTGRKVYRYFDFDNQVPNNDNTSSSHGTECAGIAAANGNNGIGLAGMAPKVRIMGIDSEYTTITPEIKPRQEFEWAAGIANYKGNPLALFIPRLMVPGADILTVSLSIGMPAVAPVPGVGVISVDGETALLNVTRRGRNARGTLVFMSAGNQDRQQDRARWSAHPCAFSCAATWMGRFTGLAGHPDFSKEVKAYYSCYSNPANIVGMALPRVPVSWAGISGNTEVSNVATEVVSIFYSSHNPPFYHKIITTSFVGKGNVPSESLHAASVTVAVPKQMDTWLMEGIIAGQTFITVADNAGINAGDYVLLGQWRDNPAPVYFWLEVTGTVGANTINITPGVLHL